MLNKSFRIALKMAKMVRPLAGYMLVAILMGILGFLCSTFIPVLGSIGILQAAGAMQAGALSLGTIFTLVIVFAVMRGILRYAEQASNHYIAFRLLALIRDKLFQALRRLCPAKLEGKERGNLISLLTADVELLEVFYAHTISPVAIAIGMSIIMSLFIGSYFWLLGLFALVSYLIIGVGVPLFIAKQGKDVARRFRDASGQLGNHVLDDLRGLTESLQYGQQDRRLAELGEKSLQLSGLERKLKDGMGKNIAITNTLILLLTLLFFLLVGLLNLNGTLTFEQALVPFVAFVSSFGPVLALANLGSTLQPTFAAAERVFEILEESPMVEENLHGESPAFSGAGCNNVTFSYGENGQSAEILKDFSIDIPQNSLVGIVGKSGSGKSTLLKLLMRFWDPQTGTVSISGKNIKDWNTAHLRDCESYMTQETHLFHDTIENNIRLAKWDATQQEIEDACKKASIHDFIMQLPNGYKTQVGELGDTLSGGERQRIGLARAFLHDAPLMLLDEPTSNLDSLNEAVILKSLKEQQTDKTVILVSHRESTMRIANTVYCVENGRMS